MKSESPHHRPSQAQEISLPAVVNGTIEEKGELDYYSFEVEAGETLAFQVLSGFELGVSYWAQTEIRLYEPHQSWFGIRSGSSSGPEGSSPLLGTDPGSEFLVRPA